MVKRFLFVPTLLVLFASVLMLPAVVFAQADEVAPCPPGVTIDLPASGISLESTTTLANLDLILCNGSDEEQLVNFSTSGVPSDWIAAIRPRVGIYLITSLTLDANQREELQLRLRGPRDQSSANFVVALRGTSAAGALLVERTLSVVRTEGDPLDPGKVTVSASYPFLSGPTTNLFEFELSVVNNTTEDVSLNLGARFPQGWQVQFLPAFGAERLITNVSIVAALNQRIKVRVTPPRLAPADDYPIMVRLADETETYVSEIPLQVTVTGNFEIFLTTPDGKLNVNADAGEVTSISLRIVNTGTAEITGLNLLPDAPAGWEIAFQTSVVPSLPGNNLIDVGVDITPPGDAVPGDYMISLRARNNDVQDNVSLRITVEKSTIWQWVGIGILVAVILALVGMFVRLGRR